MIRIVTLAALVAAVGCQSSGGARYVSRHGESGVVAISSNSPSERDKGLALIARHVGPQFVIEQEEVVMLSDETHRGRDRSVRARTNPSTSVNPKELFALETKPAMEHRIYYRRSTPLNAGTASMPTTPTSTVAPAATNAVVPASASIPASPSVPSRETSAAPVSMKSFLPLTCEGCQGR